MGDSGYLLGIGATDELKGELDRDHRTSKALGAINQTAWRQLPLETLEAIVEMVNAVKPKETDTND